MHDSELRDRLAAELADAVEAVLPALTDALMDDLARLEPAAARWGPRTRARVREGVVHLARGFLRFLALGDLEAGEVERLRALLARPLPGSRWDSALALVAPLRLQATAAARRHAADRIDGELLHMLERELGAYVELLRGCDRHPGRTDRGGLDAWLGAIEASGTVGASGTAGAGSTAETSTTEVPRGNPVP